MPQPDTPPREPPDSPTYPRRWKKRRDSGSKMILDQRKATNAFLASIQTSKTRVARGFSDALEGELGAGERLPDVALTLDLVGRSVATAFDRLFEIDRHYDFAVTRYNDLFRQCQAAAKELDPRAKKVRRAIDGVYGKSRGALIHGIHGKIRSSPEVLWAQVAGTVLGLRQRDRELPEPEAVGFEVVDREAWLREVEPGWMKLDGLLYRLADQRGEKRRWCTERQRELKAFKVVLGRGRRLVKAAYDFAGLDERARKDLYSYAEVRQLSRRAWQRRRERKQK